MAELTTILAWCQCEQKPTKEYIIWIEKIIVFDDFIVLFVNDNETF